MKKMFLSSFVILSFVLYALSQHEEDVTIPSDTGVFTPTPSAPSMPMRPDSRMGMGMMGTQYKDGVYTGSVADAYYGNVQVQVTISEGRITDVAFLDYSHDRRTSQLINSQAMPDLKSEVITVQSANVDVVSGATATSQAFIQSLQSALGQAQS